MNGFQRAARVFNAVVTPLVRLPLLRPLMGRSMSVLTYTGRSSGREFQLPVAYRRSGDELTVAVMLPDQKTWWRNFRGEGGPVSVELAGETHAGHAVSAQDARGAVTVSIILVAADGPTP